MRSQRPGKETPLSAALGENPCRSILSPFRIMTGKKKKERSNHARRKKNFEPKPGSLSIPLKTPPAEQGETDLSFGRGGVIS